MYNAPVGFNDDIVIAHALAVWSLNPIIRHLHEKPKTPLQITYEEDLRKFYEDQEYNDAW
jgi:hypothetical protein